MVMGKINVAIDGPAGAGKSTIAKAVAKKLGYLYIDTGAMYRSVGVYAKSCNIDIKSSPEMAEVINSIDIFFEVLDDGQHIYINGKDMNPFIRTPEASMAASAVALLPEVRLKLVDIQRTIAKNNNVIMDGRDIGTYVLPNADLKIFLTASVEERARRRYEELKEKGEDCSLDDVISDMIVRDKQDTEREFAPLKQAKDSILIDTTGLSLEESVCKIIQVIEKGINK